MPLKRDENRISAAALIAWHRRTKDVARVLKRAGVGRSTYYDWLNETTTIPAWGIRALVHASGDLRLLAESMGLGELGVSVVESRARGSSDLRTATMLVSSEHGRLSSLAVTALADGVVDESERRELSAQVDKLHTQVEAVRRSLSRKPAREPKRVGVAPVRAKEAKG